jgi:hypothetical protein
VQVKAVLIGAPVATLPNVAVLPSSSRPDEVFSAIEENDPAEPAVVVARDAVGDHVAAHLAQTVRGLVTDRAVAVLPVTAPPTQAVLLAQAHDWLAPSHRADQLALLVPALVQHGRTIAVVGSVSRLRSPAPSVAQHARGLLPGSRFVVDLRAGVVVNGSESLDDTPMTTTVGLVAGGPPSAWLDELPQDPRRATWVLDASLVEPRDFWGCRRWCELTGFVTPVERVVADVLGGPEPTCRFCGLLRRVDRCSFCGAVAEAAGADTDAYRDSRSDVPDGARPPSGHDAFANEVLPR